MLHASASTKKDEEAFSSQFNKTVLVSEFIKQYLNIQVLRPFDPDEILKLNKVLSGVRVRADNGKYKRNHTIRGITEETCSKVSFVAGPTTMNMIEYFQSRYNICTFDIQALDVTKEESRLTYLPIEVCEISPGQLYPKLLNKEELSVLPGATCMTGKERMLNVQEVRLNELYIGSKSTFDKFGVVVGDKVREVTARILPLPDVRPVNYDTKVKNWCILNFSHHESTEVEGFCQDIIRVCVQKGMEFEGTPMKRVFSVSANDIDLSRNFLLECSKDNLELLFVFLPKDELRPRYLHAWLKYSCDQVWGFASQCLRPYHRMQGDNRNLFDRISKKINVKMGGRNSYLCKEIYGLNESSTVTMVIGADVTHPKNWDKSSPSIAAVVASMDCGATKYKALLCPQPPGTEFITDLFTTTKGEQPGGLIRDLLLDFYQKNEKRKPERILFYRDGVGDSEFKKLLDTEVASIYKACSSLDDNYHPKITCVVVQKRHHTRFSSLDTEDGKLQLGTVVENDVCHSRMPDFYLCSANATQGHAKLNRHVVLWNDNDLTAEQLQEITYSLCHVYARCNTSVSLVTPVYYAHLAAARGREYLEGYMADIDSSTSVTVKQARALLDLPPSIANTMFFL